MALPAVSVVIPTRDRAAWLLEALESVRAQRVPGGLEVAVVDDASSDGTPELLSRYLRGRRGWRRLRLPAPRGPAAARNAGIRLGRAPHVAFLDSDDRWRPGKLERQLAELADPAAAACYCAMDLIDARGRVVARAAEAPRRRRRAWRDPFDALSGLEGPRTSAVVVRRDALRALGGFDERFRYICDDSDLWLRLARARGAAAFRRLPEALVEHRVHRGQVSARPRAARPGTVDAEKALDWACALRKHGLA